MNHRRARGVVLAGLNALSGACGGAAKQQNVELALLRHRIEELERKIDALSARDHAPAGPVRTVTGALLDTNGRPASGAVVVVVVGDIRTDGQTDDAGHFSVGAPVGGDAFFYAYKNGRS